MGYNTGFLSHSFGTDWLPFKTLFWRTSDGKAQSYFLFFVVLTSECSPCHQLLLSWFTSSYDSMRDEHRWTLASGLKLSLISRRWPSNADWRTYLAHSPKPQISTIYPQGNNWRPKANDKTNGLVYEAIAGAAYLLFSFMILTAKVAQSACVLLLIKLTD